MQNSGLQLFIKISIIIGITLALLIPNIWIQIMVSEREYRANDATYEVSSKWANQQTLAGPIVTIPYIKYTRQQTAVDTVYKIVPVQEYMHFLPTDLTINGEIYPEYRSRGVFEIVVYNSQIDFKGSFKNIATANMGIEKKNIQFDKAFVSVGISDLRGIEEQVSLEWNKESALFNPGTVTDDVIQSGINAPVDISASDGTIYDFSFSINLKGSQKLYMVPIGKITDIKMDSKWPTPSFDGSFLPDERTVSDSGFNAHWNILHLNRNYPQMWRGNQYHIMQSAFGVDLLLPVDNYQKTSRAAKYAMLFVILTFLTFFFTEVLNKVYIHPIQYLLVGTALIVFFSLLLAISEHLAFNLAYLISAIATLILVVGYIKAILKSWPLVLVMASILTILYTFIFIILQLEDYALLVGSIGVFVVLATVMFFSRKIDWSNLRMGKEVEPKVPPAFVEKE